MNRITSNLLLWTVVLAMLVLSACRPEDPGNEEEEIDTVELVFANGPTVTWSVKDTDNPTITLDANTTYTVEAAFRNDEEGEDVTAEVREEDDEHLVCFEVTSGNVTIEATDSDGTFPVGLSSDWTTGAASSGMVILTLRHQPDGEKDGTCTPGDTDVEVTFNIEIQ